MDAADAVEVAPAPAPRSPTADRSSPKVARRRDELADAALTTLADLGYARTSLREIAANTDFSHGVLHYYFDDRLDLITHAVRRYNAVCVHRYDHVLAGAATAEQLLEGFLDALASTARAEAAQHRLWYDVRSQAMVEPALRADVLEIDATLSAMVWAVVARYAELSGTSPALGPDAVYACVDGAFQLGLLRHLCGDADAVDDLVTAVRALLPRLVSPAGPRLPAQPGPPGPPGR
ncbi:MAG: TetR/AcrR family transcriptional regulator [Quadrisphaera sp.]